MGWSIAWPRMASRQAGGVGPREMEAMVTEERKVLAVVNAGIERVTFCRQVHRCSETCKDRPQERRAERLGRQRPNNEPTMQEIYCIHWRCWCLLFLKINISYY